MANEFYSTTTTVGAAALANAQVNGIPLNLTTIKVGDGGGAPYNPDSAATDLVNVVWSGAITDTSIDPENPAQMIFQTIIPANVGGWTMREAGLYADDGTLIVIAKEAETYKPLLAEGSGKELGIRLKLVVSPADNVTVTIDPTVVAASRDYVDGALAAHGAEADPHTIYELKANLGTAAYEDVGIGVGNVAQVQDDGLLDIGIIPAGPALLASLDTSGLLTDLANATLAQGDLLYFNGVNLAKLGPGIVGQVLRTGGENANPSWIDPPGGAYKYLDTVAFTTSSIIDIEAALSGYDSYKVVYELSGLSLGTTRITAKKSGAYGGTYYGGISYSADGTPAAHPVAGLGYLTCGYNPTGPIVLELDVTVGATYTMFRSTFGGGAGAVTRAGSGGGILADATALQGLRLTFEHGSAAGRAHIYGVNTA